MIFGFCFSKNLKIHIVFFQMIHYFEHYFSIYISTSMDQILWNAPIVKKLVYLSDIWIIDILTIKTCLKHRGAVFDDVKWFPWQQSSEIISLFGTNIDI